jgi:single-stranded DNA-specific DHH superfamily exonuclease
MTLEDAIREQTEEEFGQLNWSREKIEEYVRRKVTAMRNPRHTFLYDKDYLVAVREYWEKERDLRAKTQKAEELRRERALQAGFGEWRHDKNWRWRVLARGHSEGDTLIVNRADGTQEKVRLLKHFGDDMWKAERILP